MKPVLIIALLILAALSAGCAPMQRYYTVVTPPVMTPEPGKAMVIFLRPRRFEALLGGSGPAVLYDGDKYLIHLSTKQQFAYQADPGEHTFMITGVSADFLAAQLAAGKKYFVVVEPRPMFNGTTFSLRPQNGQITQKTLDYWHLKMRQIVPTPYALEMAQKEEVNRARLKLDTYTEWLQKPIRPTLEKTSGL